MFILNGQYKDGVGSYSLRSLDSTNLVRFNCHLDGKSYAGLNASITHQGVTQTEATVASTDDWKEIPAIITKFKNIVGLGGENVADLSDFSTAQVQINAEVTKRIKEEEDAETAEEQAAEASSETEESTTEA